MYLHCIGFALKDLISILCFLSVLSFLPFFALFRDTSSALENIDDIEQNINVEFSAVQTCANLVDFEKCCKLHM